MPENEEKVVESVEPKKSKSQLPLLIGVILGNIIFGIIIVLITHSLLVPSSDRESKVVETDEFVEESVVSTAVASEVILSAMPVEVIVNIAQTDGTRYLKIKFEVAYDESDRGNRNLPLEALKRVSSLRSRAVEYLSGLTLREVLDPNAQQNIRRDLLRELNRGLPPEAGRFSNIYITEYIIQ